MTQSMGINKILKDLAHQCELVEAYTRRLQPLEVINARRGNDTEPHILTEIQDLQRNIQRHNEIIEDLQNRSSLIKHSAPATVVNSKNATCDVNSDNDKLVIDFRNGNGKEDWSGVALKFAPTLDVREFTYLNITGTATENFKLGVEYKVGAGGNPRVVAGPIYELFPKTTQASNITISLKYAGALDEISLMFYEPNETSQVTIDSIYILK